MKIPHWIHVVAFLFSMMFLFGCGIAGSSGSGNSNAPGISGISPAYGSTVGGTTVTISGKNLQSGATVTFGGLAGTSVNVMNSNQVAVVTPAHAAGSVDVVVTNPGGKSATLGGGFGYGSAAPSVSVVSPNTGPTTGGTTVKITGSNFATGALVFFGAVAATGITISGPTQIQAITPSVSTASAVKVEVQNSDGLSGAMANGFTYTSPPSSSSPSVSDVSPSTATAGTAVTVEGTNFGSGATVNVGNTAASNVQFLSSTQLTATVPSVSPGTYDVTVANTNGLSATLSSGLTVADPQSLLRGCTVNTSNQPVCGSDAGSSSIPSGWTLADAQGFESGTFNSGESAYKAKNSVTIDTANAHTGTHSLDSYITNSYGGLGMILAGASIDSRTVYVSWWQYVQQANPGYGISYTDWYMVSRGQQAVAWINPDWEVADNLSPACWAACNPAQVSFYPGVNQSGYPNWGVYANTTSYPMGQWVQYEALIKANDPGSDNGDFELFQNGVLLEHISKDSYSSSRCPSGDCGNFVGTYDMTDAQLWIGGDWGAAYAKTAGGSPLNQNMASCSSGYSTAGFAGTADQLCPPSGTIPYFHIYIDDVIVLKQ